MSSKPQHSYDDHIESQPQLLRMLCYPTYLLSRMEMVGMSSGGSEPRPLLFSIWTCRFRLCQILPYGSLEVAAQVARMVRIFVPILDISLRHRSLYWEVGVGSQNGRRDPAYWAVGSLSLKSTLDLRFPAQAGILLWGNKHPYSNTLPKKLAEGDTPWGRGRSGGTSDQGELRFQGRLIWRWGGWYRKVIAGFCCEVEVWRVHLYSLVEVPW